MIWTFLCPDTGRIIGSDVPPSRYVAPKPVRTPRSPRNTSPHRPTTRNGAALSTLDNTDNDL